MPPEDQYENFDVSAVVTDIGNELFPKVEETNPEPRGSESPVIAQQDLEKPLALGEQKPAEANPNIIPGQNSVAKPLPKSWKKDMEPHWAKLPPEVHDYVHAREADVMRGIQMYQGNAKQWENLVAPFAPILTQHPDVNPVELMQGLMNTHLKLLNPSLPADQKASFARNLLSEYGIELNPQSLDETSLLLKSELQKLRSDFTALQQAATHREQIAYNQGVKEREKEVETFAAKNEFFNEAAADIHRLIQTNAATDLQSAYDMAVWTNPVIRAKLLAKQQVAQNPLPGNRNGKGQFVNVESDPAAVTRSRKPGTIDNTIDGIVAKHFPKH